jgi:MFS transporter, putative metabolite:H+ symporter
LFTKKDKLLIAVASLGYYVDAFDLILFGAVRQPSLQALGLCDAEILQKGAMLFNYQMIGMLIGGVFWGILGDKKGRKSVLFASIIMYSLANLLNGFVKDINMYALLRFLAGIGLAGELGVGVTLVSETLPKNKRGLGPMIIAVFGALGAVSAPIVVKLANGGHSFGFEPWRFAYIFGGIMGFLLLLLRLGIIESSLYEKQSNNTEKGNFLKLFSEKKLFAKYMFCILLGLPVWFIISILALVAPELAKSLNIQGKVTSGDAIIYMYLGLALGDFACGLLSQALKSRKKPIYIYMALVLPIIWYYLHMDGATNSQFYTVTFLLGIFGGFWALFITVASEQFGTNIRATVTTSVPNFVRGAVVLINLAFLALGKQYGLINAAIIIGIVCFCLAFISNYFLEESFDKDLDYSE